MLTQIYVRNETSKHRFLKSVKINTHPCFWTRTFLAFQRTAANKASAHGQLHRTYKVSPILYQTDLKISNGRGRNSKVESNGLQCWAQPQVFWTYICQLLRYSRQRPSFSAHKAASMTKTNLTLLVFSLRFVDFEI